MRLSFTSQQETSLRALLLAAQHTEFYSLWLESISTPLVRCFDLLPQVEFRHFEANREAFRNPKQGRAKVPEFKYPLQPPPKILMLLGGFRRSASTKNMFDRDPAELTGTHADTLAAPVSVLRTMARIAGPQRFPVVAFTGVRHGMLSAADREMFWKAFRVPVFEQFLGPASELIGEECDAHDGLHVREEETLVEMRGGELVVTCLQSLAYPLLRLATGAGATFQRSPCACGRGGLRLVDLVPIVRARHAGAW